MDLNLVPMIVANCHYFIVEYDYKFCHYRSIEKHAFETGDECDCHEQQIGKVITTFYAGANHVFYMSSKQFSIYAEKFPFLKDNGSVLSSVFDVKDLIPESDSMTIIIPRVITGEKNDEISYDQIDLF